MAVDRGDKTGGLRANPHCCPGLGEIRDPTGKTGAEGGARVGSLVPGPEGKGSGGNGAPMKMRISSLQI